MPEDPYFAIWQAAYHRFGQWHAIGGSQALGAALARRLNSYGGQLVKRCSVVAIEARAGAVSSVGSADGVRYRADAVLAAIHPKVALDLVEPAPSGAVVEGLRAAHAGNAVQLVVHVTTTALPAYPGAAAGDWNGLQSHVGTIAELAQAFSDQRPKPGWCLGSRQPTPSRRAHSIPISLHQGATPCTSPAHARRQQSKAAGPRIAMRSPRP